MVVNGKHFNGLITPRSAEPSHLEGRSNPVDGSCGITGNDPCDKPEFEQKHLQRDACPTTRSPTL